MAKGYGTGLVEGLHGKSGSVVFARNRDSGVTVRPYVIPTDPNTEAQRHW